MTTSKIFNRTISVFAAFLVLLCSMTLYSDNSRAANTARTYVVYDAQTGEHLRNYTLNPLSEKNNTRKIFGEDTRAVDWTKSGVVKIIIESSNGNVGFGSGFVVDSHTIATAAHCVYDYSIDVLLFNTDGTISLDATPIEVHIPNNYAPNNNNNAIVDYALITVKEDLSEYACFQLGVPTDSIYETLPDIKVTGFPAEVTINGISQSVNTISEHSMYTDTGDLYTGTLYSNHAVNNYDKYKIIYTTDTSGGNSGGPVYIEETRYNRSYNTVIAIHTSGLESWGYNMGTRIDTNLLHFYTNNSNLIWETEE